MQVDFGKILGIIGTVLVLGLLLKDAGAFNTLMGAVNSTLGQLEQAGGSGGTGLTVPQAPSLRNA